MTEDDVQLLGDILKKRSGLALTADKDYLLESRLAPVARRRGFASLARLVDALRLGRDESLLAEVTEAMTTNESYFFRGPELFEAFRESILPRFFANRGNGHTLRIWSAACSTGQEPYSLAMQLKEIASAAACPTEILATDLSREALEKAKAGLYSQFEVQRGLPIQYLVKYFSQVGPMWRIDPAFRTLITFRHHNLLDHADAMGKFDLILCRNVLIYFDPETKRQVLDNLANQLRPDGMLYLGSYETILGITNRFKPIPGQFGAYAVAA